MANLRVRQIRTNATTKLKATVPVHIDEALSAYTTAYNAEYATDVSKEELLPHILETFFLEDKAFQAFLKRQRNAVKNNPGTPAEPAAVDDDKPQPRVDLAKAGTPAGAQAASAAPNKQTGAVHPIKTGQSHKHTEDPPPTGGYQAPAPRFVDMG